MWAAGGALLLCAALGGCGDKKAIATKEKIAPEDVEFYQLGEEDAANMLINCTTDAAISDQLLEIRARQTNISKIVTEKAAQAYELGFTDYVKTNNDSLASILFMP